MALNNVTLKYTPTWCPGCGDYGIFHALKTVLAALDPEQTVLVGGIGCSSKIAQYVNTYRIETLHGRTLPVATGIKLANHKLTVIAEGGDGDGLGIGMGHFIHTARRNIDISYFIHNNQIYGLTKGQASPATDLGMITKFTPPPLGNIESPVNIVKTAIHAGATFVARGYTGQIPELVNLMTAAINHPGFAVIDILQPCVSFNKVNTYQWYQERIKPVDTFAEYDPGDKNQALTLGSLWGDVIPVGIIYHEKRMTYGDSLPQLKESPLACKNLQQVEISKLMEDLT